MFYFHSNKQTQSAILCLLLLPALLLCIGWPFSSYADSKISQLSSITTLTDGTEGVAVQTGTTKKFPFSLLKTYLGTTSHYANQTVHRTINDSSGLTTDLWSAFKISSELAGKSETNHVHDALDITTGRLPVDVGGTGVGTFTTNGVILGNGISDLQVTAAGTANQVLRIPGAGGAPAFGAIDLSSGDAVTGSINISQGGTGQTTQTAAMDALSPTNTKGDLLVDDGTNVVRLPVGTNGQMLYADSTDPEGVKWAAAPTASGGFELLAIETASSSSEITFTSDIDSTYDVYKIVIAGVRPATDSVNFLFQISTDGGITWQNGASDYQRGANWVNYATTGNFSAVNSAFIHLSAESMGNASGESGHFEITFANPSSTTLYKVFHFNGGYIDYRPDAYQIRGFGWYKENTNAIDAIRFYMSSGNIASGTFYLYGLKKSL